MQVQCPNCGGYRTWRRTGPSLFLHLVLGVVLFFVGLVVAAFFGLGHEAIDKGTLTLIAVLSVIVLPALPLLFYTFGKISYLNNPDWRYGYGCSLCGYAWTQRPGERPDVQVRPDLIRAGEERLRQEEEWLRYAEFMRQEEERRKRD